MEVNSIDKRALFDRPCVCGTLAQRLPIGLARSSDILSGDRRERNKLDGVDLDLTESHAVAAALLDSWPLPQPDGERDVSGQDVVAQFAPDLEAIGGATEIVMPTPSTTGKHP